MLYIGATESGGGAINHFDGQLDDIRVWNFERTIDQINENMNVELTGQVDMISVYYPFETL